VLPDLSPAQMRHFVLVVELESFHAAARQAHRSQPAVSLSIRELERKLGAALFEKGGRALLTPYGRYCYPQIKALLEHYQRSVDDLLQVAERRRGRVSVAAVPSVASRLLPGVLQRFIADHPQLRVSLRDGTARELQRWVRERQVDFAIASRWEHDAELDFQPLWREPIGLVCREDHPLAGGDGPLPWSALAGHELIDNGTSRLLDGTDAAQYLRDAPLSVSNMVSLTAMLEAGVAATTLPWLAFPREWLRLRFIALRRPLVEREVGLIRPAGLSLSPAAAALAALVETMASDLPLQPAD